MLSPSLVACAGLGEPMVGTEAVLAQGPAAGSQAAKACTGPWVLTAYTESNRHADVLFNTGAEHQQDTRLNKMQTN